MYIKGWGRSVVTFFPESMSDVQQRFLGLKKLVQHDGAPLAVYAKQILPV